MDCSVSADEITNHVLVRALLASDVTVDGVPCLSAGLEARAVAARFQGRLPGTAARDEIERSLRQQRVIAPQ